MLKTFVREITRLSGMEHWWGNWYVVLPKWHKYYWVDYDDIPVEVHWWLTYWDYKEWNSWMPEDLKPDDYVVWFDTAHYDDNISNWTKEDVEKETQRLSEQLN